MRPAELRTFRESLGLSAKWMATHFNVPLDRVYGWESGHGPLPDGVADALRRIAVLINEAVERAIVTLLEVRGNGDVTAPVILLRYCSDDELWYFHPELRPISSGSHAVMLGRICQTLAARDIETAIEYMDVKWYLSWLGQRTDTQHNREKWAVKAMEKNDRTLAKLKKGLVDPLTLTIVN